MFRLNKILLVEKSFILKILWPISVLGPKNFLYKKFFSKENVDLKKNTCQKNVGSKNVGSKTFWSEKFDVVLFLF